jgi:hypothetical protein
LHTLSHPCTTLHPRNALTPHIPSHTLTHPPLPSQGDWFTSRISACALVAVAYEALPDATRAEIRALFAQLCRDDTPMVRRAASASLAKLAAAMFEAGEQASLKQDLLPLFSALSTDEQDSVRLMGVENCAAMGKLLSQADNRAVLLPVIRAVAQDKSWRVRYVVAEHICELLPHVGPEARHPTPPHPTPPHPTTHTNTVAPLPKTPPPLRPPYPPPR